MVGVGIQRIIVERMVAVGIQRIIVERKDNMARKK